MSLVAITILVLACVLLLKLLKGNYGKALAVGLVLIGFVVFGLFAGIRRHVRIPPPPRVVMSINGGQHHIAFDDLEYLTRRGATKEQVTRIVRSLSRDGKVEIQYHDPDTPIRLDDNDNDVNEAAPNGPTNWLTIASTTLSDEMTEAIDELKQEVEELAEEIGEDVLAEFSSDDEYDCDVCKSDEDCGPCPDEEVDEDEAETRLAGHQGNEPPEWTYALDDWDGETFRTMVTFASEGSDSIQNKLIEEGFDRALANYTAWYREREGLHSDWYDKFPLEVRYRSTKKKALVDHYTTTKDFPIGEENETVVVTQALYEFDGRSQRVLKAHYDGVRSLARTGKAGVGFAGLMGLLATCFGFLKLGGGSSKTRRGIVPLAALMGLLGVAAGVFLLSQMLPSA